MANEKEIQEKILTYRIIEARIESLLKQRDMVMSKLMEIETTLKGMEEIEKQEEDMLLSLGSETHFFGRITDKKRMVVELGADIAIEKSFDEGKKILNRRKEEIESTIKSLERDISQLSSGLQVLESQINEMVGMGETVEKGKEAG